MRGPLVKVLTDFLNLRFPDPIVMTSLSTMTDKMGWLEETGYGWTKDCKGGWVAYAEGTHGGPTHPGQVQVPGQITSAQLNENTITSLTARASISQLHPTPHTSRPADNEAPSPSTSGNEVCSYSRQTSTGASTSKLAGCKLSSPTTPKNEDIPKSSCASTEATTPKLLSEEISSISTPRSKKKPESKQTSTEIPTPRQPRRVIPSQKAPSGENGSNTTQTSTGALISRQTSKKTPAATSVEDSTTTSDDENRSPPEQTINLDGWGTKDVTGMHQRLIDDTAEEKK